jgi:hypothetical protein
MLVSVMVYAAMDSLLETHLVEMTTYGTLPVIQVTEARLVNTLTSRSSVISALGRYDRKCNVVRK